LERRERRLVKTEKKWSWTEEGTNWRRKKADAAAEVAAESMKAFVVVVEEVAVASLAPKETILVNLWQRERERERRVLWGVLCLYQA
jgi:hypothetical protein